MVSEETQTYLLDRDLTSMVLNILRELQETVCRQLKKTNRTVNKLIGNIKKDRYYKEKSKRNYKACEYNNWNKKLLENFNNRFEQAEEKVSKFESMSIEVMQSDKWIKKYRKIHRATIPVGYTRQHAKIEGGSPRS